MYVVHPIGILAYLTEVLSPRGPKLIMQLRTNAIKFCSVPVNLTLSLSPAAFLTQTVNLDDTTVKFEIWDTAGQERYHSLAPMYYRGAQAAIVVYDITNMVGT